MIVMSDETLSADGIEPNPTAIETGQSTTTTEEPNPTAILEGAENVEADDDTDELDFGFEKYRVPKKLKEGVEALRRDHTHKSEALSHRTRDVEGREQRASEMLRASEEEIGHRARLHHVDSQLAEYAKLSEFDWRRLEAEDPLGAHQHWRVYQSLKDQKTDATNAIQQAQHKRTQDAQQDFAKRVEQARAHAAKLPGWTTQSEDQIVEFARAKGMANAELARLMSPALLEVLHFARIGETAAKTKPKPSTPAPAATPTPMVGGSASPGARKSVHEMSMEEHAAAFRKKQAERQRV